jgi:acetyl-CoA acyltransferase
VRAADRGDACVAPPRYRRPYDLGRAHGVNETHETVMSEAYIIDGVRTPIGSFGGSLSEVRPDDMAALVIQRLLERVPSVDRAKITDVIFGCANQAGEDNRNVARMALLLAGLPTSVPGETVNRLCASGLSAVAHAARGIWLGEGDLYVAGGVESMTRAPYVLSKSGKAFARDAQLHDTSIGWRFVNPRMQERYGIDSMGETAENVAAAYQISREAQDRFACATQGRAAAARARGRLAVEIVPVDVPGEKRGETRRFEHDEFIRPDTTLEKLGKLKPAFRAGGSVTAGNSSGINDGAAALLIASERAVREVKLEPIARIVAATAAGVEPRIMGMGPVPATRQVLARAKHSLDDVDVIELNEAFAAQAVASLHELGLSDDDPRVNPNGGAIALGHPLGMSGARLVLSAARELEASGGRRALATMCVGVGQGMAMLIERP